MDTAALSKLTGKIRDNMYYTEFEYTSSGRLSGARFFAYYKTGDGVYLSAGQLKQLWRDKIVINPAEIV